ncbi:hypothetical protein EHO58_13155 [Leptospira selangorensis]|uniref:hypothetical protein n=1 Tax=Leptospira selangorensis TaxID=2484982 RepID=UPI0010843677|nr:hypothetical protein [Leptospira selangorensis]TGK03368.1 hypothetical protein EHO58_13155 [Leptospira selangorensis]
MNKFNKIIILLIALFFNQFCLVFTSRENPIEISKQPKELMKPITFIVKSEILEYESGKNERFIDRYTNTVATCRCLVDFNVFVNSVPDKDEQYEYIAEVHINSERAIKPLSSISTLLSFFTLGIIPAWSKKNLEYEGVLYHKSGKQLGKFSGSGSRTTIVEILLVPFLHTKHSLDDREGSLTWIAQDIFQSGLVPKILND